MTRGMPLRRSAATCRSGVERVENEDLQNEINKHKETKKYFKKVLTKHETGGIISQSSGRRQQTKKIFRKQEKSS